MKKYFLIIILFFIFLIFPVCAYAEERISTFNVWVKILPDASLQITEEILYDFGKEKRHGIFREIPIEYKTPNGDHDLQFSNISVTSDLSESVPFDVDYTHKNINIKIGHPDILITGKKKYIIIYTVDRAINYFDTYDELYWNVTGNSWKVPIDFASARVVLPGGFSEKELNLDCFIGFLGSTEKCDSLTPLRLSDEHDNITDVTFITKSLQNKEGLTFAVSLPKGVLYEPTIFEKIFSFLKDNEILFLPIAVFIFMFLLWRKHGRDPKGFVTIVPRYDAVDNLSPIEIGVIYDEKIHGRDITSLIIDLAVRGYIKIIQKDVLFSDYEFQKLKKPDNNLHNFEKIFLDGIFSKSKTIVTLKSLENSFYTTLNTIENKVYDSLIEKKYFVKNPLHVRGFYLFIGIFSLFFGLFFVKFLGNSGLFSFVISGLIIIIFGFLMPQRTRKGVYAKEHILGFKLYLEVAEKDRINFHNMPEKRPETFEKFLPYAIALGVEKKWSLQFADLYNKKPDWYDTSSNNNFSSSNLANSIHRFQSVSGKTLSSRPSSSGSSGGGSSGGGGGGGGGGSW